VAQVGLLGTLEEVGFTIRHQVRQACRYRRRGRQSQALRLGLGNPPRKRGLPRRIVRRPKTAGLRAGGPAGRGRRNI
jgi:hypothetical protein